MAAYTFTEVAFRLAAAALIGALLGLNRDPHGKPTGVRTLGLVAIGSALAVLSFMNGDFGDASRVIQGILIGIGFLGACVIILTGHNGQIHGLTTAVCVWVTAGIGAACGIADLWLIFVAGILVLLVLSLGGRFESAVHNRWSSPTCGDPD